MNPQERGCYIGCPCCGCDYEVNWFVFRQACDLDDLAQPVRLWPHVLCVSGTGRRVRQGFVGGWRWNARSGELEAWVAERPNAKLGQFWPLGLVLWKITDQ